MLITVDGLLPPASLARARALLGAARFADGRATAGSAREQKNNVEIEPGEAQQKLAELVVQALAVNEVVSRRLFPRFIAGPLFNRYEVGMFYREHTDSPIQGLGSAAAPFGHGYVRADFSMTLFLDDPSSYDGGELEVEFMGQMQLFKLAAGSAVFYPTGCRHAVRPVTQGVRTAAVLWLQSMVRTAEERALLEEAEAICKRIDATLPGSPESALAVAHYANLFRRFANV